MDREIRTRVTQVSGQTRTFWEWVCCTRTFAAIHMVKGTRGPPLKKYKLCCAAGSIFECTNVQGKAKTDNFWHKMPWIQHYVVLIWFQAHPSHLYILTVQHLTPTKHYIKGLENGYIEWVVQVRQFPYRLYSLQKKLHCLAIGIVSSGAVRSLVSSYMQQCVWSLVRAPCSS